MIQRDTVRTFAIRLAVVYLLLVIPWPKTDVAFSAIYRGSANTLISALGLGDYLDLHPSPNHHPRGDIELTTTNPQTGKLLRIEYGSRDWGYLPLAAGLALLLAVPPPWPGRVRSGIVLVGLIILFLLARIAVAGLYGLGSVGVIAFGARSLEALGNLMLAFSATPVLTYVVPVLLWLLTLYRSFGFDFGASTKDGPRSADKSKVGAP